MDPTSLIVEFWKIHEAYIERKERLIYTAATLYFGLIVGLLLARDEFWITHSRPVLVSVIFTAGVDWRFLVWQFGLRSAGAAVCNASQTIAARWIAAPPAPGDPGLVAVRLRGRARVRDPSALRDEITDRDTIHAGRTWRDYFYDERFELYLYALIFLSVLLIFGRWWFIAPMLSAAI